MSNPYKEMLQKLVQCASFNHFSEHTTKLLVEAITLLEQNPACEEENPWIPCSDSDDLPKLSGYYFVTIESDDECWVEELYFRLDIKEFQRKNGSPAITKIIAWMHPPEPYQPPAPKPIEPDTKRVKIGEVYTHVPTDHQTHTVRSINIVEPAPKPETKESQKTVKAEPTPDPLLGWTPVWKELPKVAAPLRMLFHDGSKAKGFYVGNGYWMNTALLGCTAPVAWKYLEETPDPKLFEKPTPPPPKHQSFALQFVPFEERLPTKPGYYYLHNDLS